MGTRWAGALVPAPAKLHLQPVAVSWGCLPAPTSHPEPPLTNAPRRLTASDIASLLALQAECADAATVFAAAANLAAACCGELRLITVLRYREAEALVERVYSSEPAYSIGGTKPLAQFPLNHAAMSQGQIFHAATAAEVKAAFADHERLFAMGITAILNSPIRHAGRRLGTLNLCGRDGQFGRSEIDAARTIAASLAPSLLAPAAV